MVLLVIEGWMIWLSCMRMYVWRYIMSTRWRERRNILGEVKAHVLTLILLLSVTAWYFFALEDDP